MTTKPKFPEAPAAAPAKAKPKTTTASQAKAPAKAKQATAAARQVKPRSPIPVAPTTVALPPNRDSKQSQLIARLKSNPGVTIHQMMALTGWQAHTVRGTISAVLRKKLGLNVTCSKCPRGTRQRLAFCSKKSVNVPEPSRLTTGNLRKPRLYSSASLRIAQR